MIVCVPVPPPLTLSTRRPPASTESLADQGLAHVDLGTCAAFLEGLQVLQVPFVGLETAEEQAGGCGDLAGERHCRLARLHAAAVHADVDLDVAA